MRLSQGTVGRGWRFALMLTSLCLGAFGCANEVDPTIDPTVDPAVADEAARANVQVVLPEGLTPDETLREDLGSLEESLREMSTMLGLDGSDDPINRASPSRASPCAPNARASRSPIRSSSASAYRPPAAT